MIPESHDVPPDLARTVARLSEEVAALRREVAALKPGPPSGAELVERFGGLFRDDPVFAEMERLGRESCNGGPSDVENMGRFAAHTERSAEERDVHWTDRMAGTVTDEAAFEDALLSGRTLCERDA